MTGQDGRQQIAESVEQRAETLQRRVDAAIGELCADQPADFQIHAALNVLNGSAGLALPPAPRDGLAGSGEVRRAPNRVRPSDVIIVGARMTADVLDLVRDVEEGFAEAVRAEAVAEERQRIAALIQTEAASYPYASAILAAFRKACEIVTAGSVPVATPAESPTRCGEKRPQSDAGAYWLNAEQYDSVALCCDEPAGHAGDHRCDEGKPGHDTWPNDEGRSAAEPSVGTGTPAGPPTFDELLSDPMEQFDRRSELLPAILHYLCTPTTDEVDRDALLRSIEEYRNAPPAAATTAHMFRTTAPPTPAEAVSGGSGHAERQEPATYDSAGWHHVATQSQQAGMHAQHERDMRMADQQVASRDEQIERLTAEVARYRAAIGQAISEVTEVQAFSDGDSGRPLEPIARSLAAALGDGE
jgi:hypothetical protein